MFINSADEEHLTASLPLLDAPPAGVTRGWLALSISALARRLCKKHANCGSMAQIGKLVNTLAEMLPDSCYTNSRHDREQVLHLLIFIYLANWFIIQSRTRKCVRPFDIQMTIFFNMKNNPLEAEQKSACRAENSF